MYLTVIFNLTETINVLFGNEQILIILSLVVVAAVVIVELTKYWKGNSIQLGIICFYFLLYKQFIYSAIKQFINDHYIIDILVCNNKYY